MGRMDEDEPRRRVEGEALYGPQPCEIHRHYKGGLYIIVCRSLRAEDFEPLVTYLSNANGTVWTRTVANFMEEVPHSATNPDGPCPRFRREED